MNKKELSAEISYITGISQSDCIKVIEALAEVIKSEVAIGNKIRINGFGTFGSKLRAERRIYNLVDKVFTNKEQIVYPYFKASSIFKEKVKGE